MEEEYRPNIGPAIQPPQEEWNLKKVLGNIQIDGALWDFDVTLTPEPVTPCCECKAAVVLRGPFRSRNPCWLAQISIFTPKEGLRFLKKGICRRIIVAFPGFQLVGGKGTNLGWRERVRCPDPVMETAMERPAQMRQMMGIGCIDAVNSSRRHDALTGDKMRRVEDDWAGNAPGSPKVASAETAFSAEDAIIEVCYPLPIAFG